MFDLLRLWYGVLARLFRSRHRLLVENLALRQQLAVFKRQNSRPRLTLPDKLFWVALAPPLVFLERDADCGVA
jgi:hypothetical protein